MRRALIVAIALSACGCHFDSMIAIHYHAAPEQTRGANPTSRPASTQPAATSAPADDDWTARILRELLGKP